MPDFLNSAFAWVILGGFLLSCGIEALLIPRPALRRPLRSWLLHAGAWLFAVALLYGMTGRPYFSAVNVLALWLLIVLVSNSKYHSLREPFVCADFEYFSDAVRFPRLYLPFFGIGKTIVLALAFVAYLACGLYFEAAASDALSTAALALVSAMVLLFIGAMKPLQPSYDASLDLRRWGLAASLWTYFCAARRKVSIDTLHSPFAVGAQALDNPTDVALPDLVSVQSESFFDIRRLWPGIREQVLSQYDVLRSEARTHGRLQVAAWGANTVRTEFAFLTGIAGDRLGVHRFNPYRHLARQGLPSIAAEMKRRGYRTVCIHPYAGSFYGRDRVLPALGFDEFIDVRSFNDGQKAGPFIGDCAVADKIIELLDDNTRTQPLYIHAVTMENHGPLHLEQVEAAELPTWFDRPLLDGMRDLAPYLRHLSNADRMLGTLREYLLASPTSTGLCFFGDHVPILPDVYCALGAPDGDTDFFIWSNQAPCSSAPRALSVEQLAKTFVEQSSSRAASSHPSRKQAGPRPQPMTDIDTAALRIALGSSLSEPDESIVRMITSGRSSLAFFLGDEACRYRLLAESINWDRILIAYRDCTPLGYAAFKHHRRGPFSPGAGPFVREFGRLRGVLRYLLFAMTEGREWYYGFYLYGLHVIKHARHQGIARSLLTATFDQARRAGHDRVELEVQVKNQRARRLYVQLGFTRVRSTPVNWLGRLLPFPAVINMRRSLTSQP